MNSRMSQPGCVCKFSKKDVTSQDRQGWTLSEIPNVSSELQTSFIEPDVRVFPRGIVAVIDTYVFVSPAYMVAHQRARR